MTHAATPSPDLETRILAEASALFRTRGYEATSVREVAEAVGVLPGSLHYRFPTKAHMLIAIARKAVDEMSEAMDGVRARTDDPIRRIELALEAFTTLLFSDESHVMTFFESWPAIEAEDRSTIYAFFSGFVGPLDEMFKEAMETGAVRTDMDRQLLRHLVFAPILGLARMRMPYADYTPKKISHAVWRMLETGIVRRPPA